ncbi:MAG: putative bifunctional diguanylate cyclase/phosphodiesterase [Elainellaceae cyanobacterium]
MANDPMAKILVIEDREAIRDNIQEVLEFENFETIVAENGRIGVALAKEHSPDLIVCDVMMPELDGYGVLTALRQDESTARIPFIFLTAKADRSALRQGMDLGADDYLTKPFTTPELLRAISVRLDKQAYANQHYADQIEQLEARLDYLTYHNDLTQLPNQIYLQQQFSHIQAQDSDSEQRIAFLLISLDQFNRISETLGYPFGNLLLETVAERLKAHLQSLKTNIHTIAQLDLGKIAILFEHVERKQDVFVLAQSLLQVFSHPFVINPHKIYLTASLGIAYSSEQTTLDTVIGCAEAAAKQARQEGGNCYRLYTQDLRMSSQSRFVLETSLYDAIEREEFQVYYQPQVDLESGKVIGAEALARWQHPDLGFISPSEFIPLAEETGLIIPLGDWILRTACTQAKAWQVTHTRPLKISVNLSVRQFYQPSLTQKIAQILEETGLEPRFLDLELTESILIQDVEKSIKIFDELKALGVYISIDDFGVGYSSLSYLQKIPFDVLKVDQCFIRNVTDNPTNMAIAQAIFQIARSLGLRTTAEGVETESELAFVQQHQCDVIQGYLFSPPLPPKKFDDLLKTGEKLNNLRV